MDGREQLNDLGTADAEGPDRVVSRVVGVPVGDRTGPVPERRESGLIDALRGLSAVVIAAHHICLYGPLSDRAARLVPWVIDGLLDYGRLGVQVFLVISGFATTFAVGHMRAGPAGFIRFAARRYVRLGFPYLVVILVLLTMHALSPPGFAAFPLFDELSWELVLAHVFFLQDILGYPSLSAGFWYLGIDYQFCLLFFLLILLHRGLIRLLRVRSRRLDVALLLALSVPWAVLSIFAWNLNPDNEAWVHHYLASLFVGVVCAWALVGRVPGWVFWAYAGAVMVGLIVQWRSRLALALTTGVLIYLAGRGGSRIDRAVAPWLRFLGRISYSLFLVHYPTSWVVTSLGTHLSGDSATEALIWMLLSFGVSLAVAVVMFLLVERPSRRLAECLR